MGCDIHMVCEVQGDDGKWYVTHVDIPDPEFENEGDRKRYYDWETKYGNKCHDCKLVWVPYSGDETPPPELGLQEGDLTEELAQKLLNEHPDWCLLRVLKKGYFTLQIPRPYARRSYNLFAVLAGVRNYASYEPMFEDRGLPEDCSAITALWSQEWGEDGHSHGYCTLAEIDAYHWDKLIPRSGYISFVGARGVSGYLDYRKTQKIGDHWWDEPPRHSTRMLTVKEAEAEIKRLETDPAYETGVLLSERLEHWYVHVEWQQSYAEAAHYVEDSDFYRTVQGAKALAPNGDLTRVRFVYFFDN